MSKGFPDIVIRENGRQLRVRTEYDADNAAWATSIVDDTRDGQFSGSHVGDFIVGQTALWGYNAPQVVQARTKAANDARTGPIR